jgi:hypothetical protein
MQRTPHAYIRPKIAECNRSGLKSSHCQLTQRTNATTTRYGGGTIVLAIQMQIMVRLAIQNGKNGVRGNYDWRAVSERALHKKARHVPKQVGFGYSVFWSRVEQGQEIGAVVPAMNSVAIVD